MCYTFISSKTVILTGNLCSTDIFSNKNGFEIENSQMEKKYFPYFLLQKTFEYKVADGMQKPETLFLTNLSTNYQQIRFFDKKHQLGIIID